MPKRCRDGAVPPRHELSLLLLPPALTHLRNLAEVSDNVTFTLLQAGLGAVPGLTGIYELTRISPPIYLPLPSFYGRADRDSAIGLSKFGLFVGCK